MNKDKLIEKYKEKASIQHDIFQLCADFIDLFDDKIDHNSPEVKILTERIGELRDRNNDIADEIEKLEKQ